MATKKVDPILSAPTIGDFKKRFYNLVVKEGHASAATGGALLPPLLRLHYTIFVAVTTHNGGGVGIAAAFVPYTDAERKKINVLVKECFGSILPEPVEGMRDRWSG
jgi:hypothetical protein